MTDRIEAIRARWEADPTNIYPSDIGWLLVEVGRLEDARQSLSAQCSNMRTKMGDAEARAERVWTLQEKWVHDAVLACGIEGHGGSCADCSGHEYAKEVRAALAPVAPDAEPTEWVWSLDDAVQGDADVWHRVSDYDGYPWRSATGSDQRDQDITDLVTKHGGRVLVCKARGIGGAS